MHCMPDISVVPCSTVIKFAPISSRGSRIVVCKALAEREHERISTELEHLQGRHMATDSRRALPHDRIRVAVHRDPCDDGNTLVRSATSCANSARGFGGFEVLSTG